MLVGLLIGVLFGLALQTIYAHQSELMKISISWFNIVSNGYLQLLKMIIMLLVFASILLIGTPVLGGVLMTVLN